MWMEQASIWAGAIGALAFFVSVIIQATKELPGLKRLPTDAQVIAVSLVLALAAVFAAAEITGTALRWYMLAAVLPGGLLVSFVAMYGWATTVDLWQRFQYQGDDDDV